MGQRDIATLVSVTYKNARRTRYEVIDDDPRRQRIRRRHGQS
jgi:hypothetical protein